MDIPKLSGARVNKLTSQIDDVIESFVLKNTKTTNEEIHLALHRIYQMRELQPVIMLTKAFMEKRSGKAEYIQ